MARPEAEILKDLRRVENELSPENLHCDGEISRKDAHRKYVRLTAEQNKLHAELGRKPTDAELYPDYFKR